MAATYVPVGDKEPAGPEEFPPTAPAAKHPLFYPNAEAWVNGFMLPHFRRRPNAGPFRWDPRWWAYEESGTVIEGLWEVWEQKRWEGATGILDYFRDYFYPLLRELTGPEGPFWAYDPPKCKVPPEMWLAVPAPDGWFRGKGNNGAP